MLPDPSNSYGGEIDENPFMPRRDPARAGLLTRALARVIVALRLAWLRRRVYELEAAVLLDEEGREQLDLLRSSVSLIERNNHYQRTR